MQCIDYYKVLGVERNASYGEILDSFIVAIYVAKDKDKDVIFKALETLGNPNSRKLYDLNLSKANKKKEPEYDYFNEDAMFEKIYFENLKRELGVADTEEKKSYALLTLRKYIMLVNARLDMIQASKRTKLQQLEYETLSNIRRVASKFLEPVKTTEPDGLDRVNSIIRGEIKEHEELFKRDSIEKKLVGKKYKLDRRRKI